MKGGHGGGEKSLAREAVRVGRVMARAETIPCMGPLLLLKRLEEDCRGAVRSRFLHL